MPDHLALELERVRTLRSGAIFVRGEPAMFEITGPGAVYCMQGLLTNDVDKPGDYSLVYGALLTPKGMIILDGWVTRLPERVLFVTDRHVEGAASEIFRRNFPPRLARARELTGAWGAISLYGDQVLGSLRFAGLGAVPEAPSRAALGGTGSAPLVIARGNEAAPFRALLLGELRALDEAAAALTRTGAQEGNAADAAAARVLAGWPALRTEIGERTLPQEVRFDEIDGVSYTKGCYVGQETVARLHFRGHANRELRGLIWSDDTDPRDSVVRDEAGREVGSIGSMLALGTRRIALAVLRHEVKPGDEVNAGGSRATVVTLPFQDQLLA